MKIIVFFSLLMINLLQSVAEEMIIGEEDLSEGMKISFDWYKDYLAK